MTSRTIVSPRANTDVMSSFLALLDASAGSRRFRHRQEFVFGNDRRSGGAGEDDVADGREQAGQRSKRRDPQQHTQDASRAQRRTVDVLQGPDARDGLGEDVQRRCGADRCDHDPTGSATVGDECHDDGDCADVRSDPRQQQRSERGLTLAEHLDQRRRARVRFVVEPVGPSARDAGHGRLGRCARRRDHDENRRHDAPDEQTGAHR